MLQYICLYLSLARLDLDTLRSLRSVGMTSGRLNLDTLDCENKFSSLGMTNRCHIEVSTESAHRVYLAVGLYLDTLRSLHSVGMTVED